jgi:hypothetical protein
VLLQTERSAVNVAYGNFYLFSHGEMDPDFVSDQDPVEIYQAQPDGNIVAARDVGLKLFSRAAVHTAEVEVQWWSGEPEAPRYDTSTTTIEEARFVLGLDGKVTFVEDASSGGPRLLEGPVTGPVRVRVHRTNASSLDMDPSRPERWLFQIWPDPDDA